MSLNVKLLRKVKRHILEEPRRFFMDNVIETGRPGSLVELDGERRALPKCGTAACIAGWACLLSNLGPHNVSMNRAENLLGINCSQGSDLFLADYWPTPFRQQWRKAKTLSYRSKIAGERIEHFIKTGE